MMIEESTIAPTIQVVRLILRRLAAPVGEFGAGLCPEDVLMKLSPS
jgi:hypothetical protein